MADIEADPVSTPGEQGCISGSNVPAAVRSFLSLCGLHEGRVSRDRDVLISWLKDRFDDTVMASDVVVAKRANRQLLRQAEITQLPVGEGLFDPLEVLKTYMENNSRTEVEASQNNVTLASGTAPALGSSAPSGTATVEPPAGERARNIASAFRSVSAPVVSVPPSVASTPVEAPTPGITTNVQAAASKGQDGDTVMTGGNTENASVA